MVNLTECVQDFVEHHNMLFMSGKKTHTVGMNKFADLSNEEYGRLYLSQVSDLAGPHPPMCTPSSIAANSTAPDSADWRPLGAVTPIKDQGQCGSCWAFSTIASLEGQWFLAGNTLTSLAEQQLVDCDQSDSEYSGRWLHSAYDKYVIGADVCSEDSYTCTARERQNLVCSRPLAAWKCL